METLIFMISFTKTTKINIIKVLRKTIVFILFIIGLLLIFSYKVQAAKTNVKVAVNCTLPPFQYFDKSGHIAGLHVDVMDEIAAKENLIIEYIAFGETNKALEALENGIVDVVLGVLTKNDISSSFQKTNDISSANLCMLVRNENIEMLNFKEEQLSYTTAFELGTISFSQLSQLKNSGNNIVLGNQEQLFKALINKQVQSAIGIKESMIFMLEDNKDSDSYTIVHNYISSVDYTMVMRKGDRVLYNSINRGISRLRTSLKYQQLLEKWLGNIELRAAREMKIKMFSYIAIFVFLALVIIGAISYMNHKLKIAVLEKTKEISKRILQLENESTLREQLIEFSPAGIMLLKKDGTVLMMNSILRLMADIKEDFNGNLNISNLNILNEIYEQAKSKCTPKQNSLIVKIDRDEKRIFRCNCQNINIDDDMAMMVEDITREEREKQEIFELRKSKALNRIIAGMAHEIKNPLMAINTFSSLIGEQGKEEEFQALFMEHVPKEVDRINRLINMLINYSRPIRSKKGRISVSELLNETMYFAKILSKDNDSINFKTKENIQAYIYVNKDQIKQALINLVMNSIQSIEEKLLYNNFASSLDICLYSYYFENQVCFEVYDEGCGMNESEIERCMDPFYSTKATGLGMGLSLTKQFINDNSGKLIIQSKKDVFTSIKVLFKEDKQ